MSAARPMATRQQPSTVDHFVYLRVGWDDYEKLLAMRGEGSVPRITYLRGRRRAHVSVRNITRATRSALRGLLEARVGTMQPTCTSKAMARGRSRTSARNAAPRRTSATRSAASRPASDGAPAGCRDRGDLDLGWNLQARRVSEARVREVWFYERGTLRFFALRADSYVETPRSELLPQLPVELLLECMREPEPGQTAAVRTLRARLGTPAV